MASAGRTVRVAYFVQSHRQPEQVLRLLGALRGGSPTAVLVSGHCPRGRPLDPRRLAELDVQAFLHERPAERAYWSILEPWFTAVERLAQAGVEYDWLVHLSESDYPVQRLAASERQLAESDADGFLDFRPCEAPAADGRRRQGILRYHYQYRDVAWPAPIVRLVRGLNGVQSFWHLHTTYGPRLGVRARLPRGGTLRIFRGWWWTTLRRPCAERVLQAAREDRELVAWFTRTVSPEEAFSQTVLLAEPGLRLRNDCLRYIDPRCGPDGRPRTLTMADAPALVGGAYHFARKFDPDVDAGVLDWLDRHALGIEAAAPALVPSRQ